MRSFFTNKAKRYAKDTEGSVAVEFVIYLPLMLFIFAMIYTFFDAFRQESINLKAAYTVSDLVSRETQELNEDYIDSLHNMTELLVRPDSDLSTRFTIVRWDEDDQRYYVDWSRERGDAFAERTDTDIMEVSTRLPDLADQERVILIETYNVVTPPFPVVFLELFDADFSDDPEALAEQSMLRISNFVFTRPRFAPLVRFEGVEIPEGSHDDDTLQL